MIIKTKRLSLLPLFVIASYLAITDARCGDKGAAYFNKENKTKQGFDGELYSAVRCHLNRELCNSTSLPEAARGVDSDDKSKLNRYVPNATCIVTHEWNLVGLT